MAASSIRQLRKKTVPLRRTADDSPPLTAADDPLGLDLQARGMENARQHMTPFGPLPDPKWAGFFQALADAGVDKLVAGRSAPGSNQLRGQSLQPWTTPGTAGDALEGVAASMPFAPFAPVEGAPPPAPNAPPAPKAPPVPPPSPSMGPGRATGPAAAPSAAPSLGALAAQTGASPGLVTRYRNAPGSRRVGIDPNAPTAVTDVGGSTPEDAAAMLRNLRLRTVT